MKGAKDAPTARLTGICRPAAGEEPCVGCGGELLFVVETAAGGHAFGLRRLLEALWWMREAAVFPDLGEDWWHEVRAAYGLAPDANGAELGAVVAGWKAAGVPAWRKP